MFYQWAGFAKMGEMLMQAEYHPEDRIGSDFE